MSLFDLVSFINDVKEVVTSKYDAIGQQEELESFLKLPDDIKYDLVYKKTLNYLLVYFCIALEQDDINLPYVCSGPHENVLPVAWYGCRKDAPILDIVSWVKILNILLTQWDHSKLVDNFTNSIVRDLAKAINEFYISLIYHKVHLALTLSETPDRVISPTDVYSALCPGASASSFMAFSKIYPYISKCSFVFEVPDSSFMIFSDRLNNMYLPPAAPKTYYHDQLMTLFRTDTIRQLPNDFFNSV